MTVKKDPASGTWLFVLDGPKVYDADAGVWRRQQHRRRGFKTNKAAEPAEAEVRADVHRGRCVRPARMTVEEYLTGSWLPARKVNLRASIYQGYEKVIRTRVNPHLGMDKLASIDAARLEAFYGQLLESGGERPRALAEDGGQCSPASCHWRSAMPCG